MFLQSTERWKHKEVSLDEVFKGCILFAEAATLEPETQVHGVLVIFDMGGLTMQQATQFSPGFAKRMLEWMQECVPMRIKGIHVVNQPKIFEIVFALFKPFLREKLRKRVHFHGNDLASLHKHITPTCLLPAYGGAIPRVNGDQWLDVFSQCDREYKAINSYGFKN